MVGTESGLGPPQNMVAAAASAMQEQNRIAVLGDNYKHIKSKFNVTIQPGIAGDNTNQPYNNLWWPAGVLTVGPDSYAISASGGASATAASDDLRFIWFDPKISTTTMYGGSIVGRALSETTVVIAFWRRGATGSDDATFTMQTLP